MQQLPPFPREQPKPVLQRQQQPTCSCCTRPGPAHTTVNPLTQHRTTLHCLTGFNPLRNLFVSSTNQWSLKLSWLTTQIRTKRVHVHLTPTICTDPLGTLLLVLLFCCFCWHFSPLKKFFYLRAQSPILHIEQYIFLILQSLCIADFLWQKFVRVLFSRFWVFCFCSAIWLLLNNFPPELVKWQEFGLESAF